MTIQALGYLAVGSPDLEDWTSFATGRVGMQAVDRGRGLRAFRMDDRKQRLVIDAELPAGQKVFGWEVADAGALDALAARLERAGVAVRQEGAAMAGARCVSGLISFADPAGNRLEAFHGAQIADTPFRPGRAISGFRTGPQGIGHTLLTVTQLEPALNFYRNLLGFRISDFMRAPVKAFFLHVNARHHSLALVEAPHAGMHHLMVEFFSLDDVGQNYDLALGEKRVAVTLGRHCNDLMTSFYMRTPGDILVECGWGGREVDDATWQPQEMDTLDSYWGHHGLFAALEDGPQAQIPVPMPRPEGRRAPVYVMDGNYQRMTGVCPWWDGMRAGA